MNIYEVIVRLKVKGDSPEEAKEEVEAELSFTQEFWKKVKDVDYEVDMTNYASPSDNS